MEIRTTAQAQLIKVSPANLGSRKTSKIRVVLEMEHTRERWDTLGRLFSEAEVVDVTLAGKPVQPELDGAEDPLEGDLGLGDAGIGIGEDS